MISNAMGSPAFHATDLKKKIQLPVPVASVHLTAGLASLRPVLQRDQVQFSGAEKKVSRGTKQEERETRNLNTIIIYGGGGLAIGCLLGTVAPGIGNFAGSIAGALVGLVWAAIKIGRREKN